MQDSNFQGHDVLVSHRTFERLPYVERNLLQIKETLAQVMGARLIVVGNSRAVITKGKIIVAIWVASDVDGNRLMEQLVERKAADEHITDAEWTRRLLENVKKKQEEKEAEELKIKFDFSGWDAQQVIRFMLDNFRLPPRYWVDSVVFAYQRRILLNPIMLEEGMAKIYGERVPDGESLAEYIRRTRGRMCEEFVKFFIEKRVRYFPVRKTLTPEQAARVKARNAERKNSESR